VDKDGNPADVPEVELRVSGKDFVDTLPVLNAGQPGRFKGRWHPRDLGQYTLSYTDAAGRSVTAMVHVAGSSRELRRPDVDRATMADIAEASGGDMIELAELGTLPDKLKGEAKTVQRLHEDEIWDNWLVLVLLVFVYCLDVGTRRLLGLT
jgi:hypothetical protein